MDYYRQNSLLSSAKVPTLDMTNTNRGVQQATGLIDNLIERDRAKKQQEIENQYRQDQLLLQRAADKRAQSKEAREQDEFDSKKIAKYNTGQALLALTNPENYAETQVKNEQEGIKDTLLNVDAAYDKKLEEVTDPLLRTKIETEKQSEKDSIIKSLESYYNDVNSGERNNQIISEVLGKPGIDVDSLSKWNDIVNPKKVYPEGEYFIDKNTGELTFVPTGDPVPKDAVTESIYEQTLKNSGSTGSNSKGTKKGSGGFSEIIETLEGGSQIEDPGPFDRDKILTFTHNANGLGLSSNETKDLLNQTMVEGTPFFPDGWFDRAAGSVLNVIGLGDRYQSQEKTIEAFRQNTKILKKIQKATGIDELSPEQATQLLFSNKFVVKNGIITNKTTGKEVNKSELIQMLTPKQYLDNFDVDRNKTPASDAVLNLDNNTTSILDYGRDYIKENIHPTVKKVEDFVLNAFDGPDNNITKVSSNIIDSNNSSKATDTNITKNSDTNITKNSDTNITKNSDAIFNSSGPEAIKNMNEFFENTPIDINDSVIDKAVKDFYKDNVTPTDIDINDFVIDKAVKDFYKEDNETVLGSNTNTVEQKQNSTYETFTDYIANDKNIEFNDNNDSMYSNKNSNLFGKFNMKKSTALMFKNQVKGFDSWDDFIGKNGDDKAIKIQKEVMKLNTKHNAKVLDKMGQKVNYFNLWLAHNLGPTKAVNLLKNNPSKEAKEFITKNMPKNQRNNVTIDKYKKYWEKVFDAFNANKDIINFNEN
jgi:hypothetical protein